MVACSQGGHGNTWDERNGHSFQVLRGTADANIAFRDPRRLLLWLGFRERTKEGHHIFTREGVEEILNLQPRDSKAKPYQVKQVRELILKYKLAQGGESEGGDSDGQE